MLERLNLALARTVWRHGVLAGLLMGLVGVLSFNLDHAGWVAGVQWWPGAWLALLIGALLAISRWRGRWALLYSLALIMAGAAESVGHLLPEPAQLTQAPSDWVVNLHLRAVTLGLRLQAWQAAIAHGQTVGDTGLFVWLLALITWGAVAWLAWSVLRRRQALAGVVPAAIVMAVNTYLSAQSWQLVLLFFALTLGLVIASTYIAQNADWDQRGVDYPGDLAIDWSTAAMGLTLSIGLLSAAAPVVATPTGWRLLGDMFAASQQQVASTADQLFTGVRQPSVGAPPAVARTPDLSNIGAGIDQGQNTVMWVKLDEPAPATYPGAPAPPQHYWRSGLYATYTGTGWQPLPLAPGGDAAAPEGLDPPPPGRYTLQQQFEIVAEHGQSQFAVNRPVSATAGALVRNDPGDPSTALLAGAASKYSLTSLATRVSESELRSAGTDYPAVVRGTYLQLPASLPARVADLAAQIAGAGAPYDQALRLQDYLRRTYLYRLDVPPPPAGRDAVDYFLYEAPGGYCSYYASAMAVMLRALSVPSRVATGYAMGDYDLDRGAYRVVGAEAHAWVEVYFPTYGWVEFEPTPARATFQRPVGDAALTPTPFAPPASSTTSVSSGSRVLAVVLGLIGLLTAVAGWLWWQAASRRPPDTPRQQALILYRRMRGALARAGLDASASVTPDEYLRAGVTELSGRPALLSAMTQVTDLYREAAYSQHPVSEAETHSARSSWAGVRLEWVGLALGRLLRATRRGRQS